MFSMQLINQIDLRFVPLKWSRFLHHLYHAFGLNIFCSYYLNNLNLHIILDLLIIHPLFLYNI